MLYQFHTRIWMTELAQRLGRPATLADIPDDVIRTWADLGFEWVWPLGVWQTGSEGPVISRTHPGLRDDYARMLPDFTDADISGSPFAIIAYSVHRDFGGDAALAQFRQRLASHGLKLLLDFIPNHVALDHPWAAAHPEFFVHGSPEAVAAAPQNFMPRATRVGLRNLAHGRDPYFDGWTDTLQLNYRHAGLRAAMLDQLQSVAARCDGVRCDMAMLLLPHVIQQAWAELSLPADGSSPIDDSFWAWAIPVVKARFPDFQLMAEVYWDLEYTLQQQGFDLTYDKRLYDRLHIWDARGVHDHLLADLDYQRRSVRFLENHDEPRAASNFSPEVHPAAATIAFMVPGFRFFHDGQFTGWTARESVHLSRRPAEPVNPVIHEFYFRLLQTLRRPVLRFGTWRLLEARPAWHDNPTHTQFICFSWTLADQRLLVCVNYAPSPAQCYVQLPWADLPCQPIRLRDLFSDHVYDRSGDDLASRGLYLDVPPWTPHAFEVSLLS